jgi:C1A family cysteine protease
MKPFSKLIVYGVVLGTATGAFASDEELQKVNEAILHSKRHWKAQKTSISEMAPEERVKRSNGVLPGDPLSLTGSSLSGATGTVTTSGTTAGTTVPATLDWRNMNGVNYVTPIKNQGSCGSCWAFATTAGLESQVLMTQQVSLNLSEQIVLSCSGAGSCNGGYPSSASTFIQNTGVPGENYFPYTGSNTACSSALTGWQNYTQKITSYKSVSASVSAIETALATYGPLVTTFSVYNDFYYYKGGVYQLTPGATYEGGHAVLIVGYDDVNQYFIVKNSWGTGWGESGFFKIGFSELSSLVHFGSGTLAYYSSNAAPSIALASPAAGSTLYEGTNANIQWNYQGSPGSTVSVELLQNGSPALQIASSVSIGSNGQGSMTWNIPASLPAGSGYQIQVTSVANPLYSSTSGVFSLNAQPPAPTAPSSLQASIISSKRGKRITSAVALNWVASSSQFGISSYNIYRNGSKLANSSTNSFTDTNTVAGGGTYTYTVQAVDAIGQTSAMSNPVSITR